MLPVVQDREDKDMAQPASPIPNSDGTLLWSTIHPREMPLTAMIAAHLLQLTCVTSQQQRHLTRHANAPSADMRNIRITHSRSQWYIGHGDEEYEPASDNAYFAEEAVEHNHALITLNDRVLQTLDYLFVNVLTHTQGVLCIQDSSVLGGVSINGKILQKHTHTILPSSSKIVLTRAWNPISSSKQLRFEYVICIKSAPQAGHTSSPSRLSFAWPLLPYRASKTALLPAPNSNRSSTIAQRSTLDPLL
jgi:hypothetical protein